MLRQSMHDLLTRAVGALTYVRSGHTSHEWDISGSCYHPQMRVLESTPLINGRIRYGGWGHQKRTTLYMRVRCRMCDACKRLKQALWTARAERETITGLRNWFGTLTLSPASHHQIISRCRQKLGRGGTDYDGLSREEQFSEWMTEISKEVTKYVKRVRKESRAPLRYLLVAEEHQSGVPHLHLLMHEQCSSAPVRYRTLSTQWKLGFTKFNLVDGMKAARYVCKYISKSAMARVRASLHYGRETPQGQEERRDEGKKAPEKKEEERKTTTAGLSRNPFSLTDRNGGKNSHGYAIWTARSVQRAVPPQFGNAGSEQSGSLGGASRAGIPRSSEKSEDVKRAHSGEGSGCRVSGLGSATAAKAPERTVVGPPNPACPRESGTEPGARDRVEDYKNGLAATPF